ncbi:MAG TPA: hypothetical protein VFY66_08730 [Anaerolineales bacterium]|nr:hypothetical protein [Anaerolineales bacterium]
MSVRSLRYLLVGGTRQRRFAGTNLKPRKVPENAQTPTGWVHVEDPAQRGCVGHYSCLIMFLKP